MKMIVAVCFLALVGVTLAQAQPQPQQPFVQLVRYDNVNDGLGSYSFNYELTDGTKRQEQGQLKNAGTENEALEVQGSYTWVSPEGKAYLITFIANENGFQPQIQELS